MKTHLLILSFIATVAFSSCGKESVESGDTTSRIAFKTLMSKGSTVTNAAGVAASGGFNVLAYSHAGNWSGDPAKSTLLDDATVTSADAGLTWSYTPGVDWPTNGNFVSFFAYSPTGSATVDGVYYTLDVPIINFVVNSDPLLQEDLLIANPQYDQLGLNYGNRTPVNINFTHALSQVRFSAILAEDMAPKVVKVKSVEMRNLYNQGSTTLETPVAWDLWLFAQADYTVSIGSGLSDLALTTTAQEISPDNALMFLMPQTIQRDTSKIEMYVTLSVDGSDVSYTVEVFSPAVWAPGRVYNYQLSVTADDIQLIVIDSEMTLAGMTKVATYQSVILTDDQATDQDACYKSLDYMQMLNTNGMVSGTTRFGVYGTYDLLHDITIDLSTDRLSSFTPASTATPTSPAQYLIFDFKKVLGVWGLDGSNQPWTVSVINYAPLWELAPSFQTAPGANASTGATTTSPSNVMQNRGTIYLRRVQ